MTEIVKLLQSGNAVSLDELSRFLRTSTALRVLEPRVVFDGAAAPAVAEAVVESDVAAESIAAGEGAESATSNSEASPPIDPAAIGIPGDSNSVVFIDSKVTNPGELLAAIPAGSDIVLLDPSRDGLSQIAEYLSGRSGVSTVHILSHGEAGEMHLGSATVTAASIASGHADELAAIKSALSADADILIYGCNVALGDVGQAFVAALSEATGADVAASVDDTGAGALGGDWELETRTGLIEAGLIDAPEWNGLLAPLTISTTLQPAVTGATGTNVITGLLEGGVGYTALWTNAGTIGSTLIDVRATVTSLTASTVSYFTQGDDLSIILNGGATATIKWEIFAADASHSLTIYAVGSPNFRISDIDGVGGLPNTREIVRPQLNGLTGYTVDSPTNLVAAVSTGGVQVSGTQNQNGEATSLTAFTWQDVSTWQVEYTLVGTSGFLNAVFRHDGDGDFTFVAPNTVNLLSIDLDGNNSAASGTSYQASYVENGAGVRVVDFNDIVITQNAVLGANLGSASVVLTNAKPGDILTVGALPSGISATVDTSVSGVITVTLTGTATVADYQDALQAITFSSTSENPSTTDRQIEVSVTNTTFGTSSNQAVSTIHVAPVSDPPIIDLNSAASTADTNRGYAVSSTEGGAAVNIASSTSADIFDVGENDITSLTIVTGSVEDGAAEIVTIAGQSFQLGVSATVSNVAVGGSSVNIAYLAATGTFTVTNATGSSNPILQADLDTLVRGITYENSSDTPTAGDRTLTFTVTDSGNLSSVPAVSTITVVPANDMPIVDLNSAASPSDVNRDYAVTFNENGAVVNVADAGLADVSDLGENDITTFTITLSGFVDGASEIVQVAGHDFPASEDQTITALSIGGALVDITYLAATGVFTITNTAGATNPIPGADLDLLVRGITYINTSYNPTGGDRTVTFSATDADGAQSADAVSTITVEIFNDAPSAAISVINPGDVVVIDLSVANAQALIDALPAGTSFLAIPQGVDGIFYLAGQLAGRHDITALHILSHGEAGELHLGGAVLNSANVQTAYSASLAIIGATLTADADILIYGCNIGQDALFVQRLADASQADVAASTDNTGHVTLGGNWTLEEFAGPIETAALAPLAWEGLLAPVNTGSWTVVGTTATNISSGVTTTISFAATSANSSFSSFSNQTFNNISAFSSATVQGAASLGAVFTWDTTPEAATGIPQPQAAIDSGTGTVTITFSQAVTNPIINIDRIGGNALYDPNTLVSGDEDSRSNSSLWTVLTPGATLTKLSGVSHLSVTSTTFQRTPNAVMAAAGTTSESGTNATLNTAAGSVRVNGTFTSITFRLSGVGVEGGGADGFEIGVRFDPANMPPAVATPSYTTPEDTPKVLTGISFSDPDASTGNVTVTLSVASGTLDINTLVAGGVTAAQVTGDNTGTITITAPLSAINATLANATGLTYTPVANFTGTVVLTSSINDNGNTGQGGPLSTSTMANIVVTPVNDAPIVDLNSAATTGDTNRGNAVAFTENGAAVNVASTSLADVSDIGENDITTLTIAAGNMTEGASDIVTIGGASFPLNTNSTQTVTIGGTTFSIAYTTAGGFAITKSGGGVIPQADLDTLIRGVTYQNTSEAPAAGNRTLTFAATDSGGLSSSPAVATITVTPVNDLPVAVNDAASVTEDTTATGNVLTNDTDLDGGPLTVTQFTVAGVAGTFSPGATATIPGVGTLVINANGSYTFTPLANYDGPVPVATYTVSDGNGGTDTGDLVLTMIPVNDTPVAVADSGSGLEDTPVVIDVLANDTDVENALDPATVVITTTPPGATLNPDGKTLTVPGQGVWTVNPATGAITFTPAAEYNGTPTPITYHVTDTGGMVSNTVSVSVTITPVNDTPIIDLNSAASAGDANRGNPTTFTEGDAAILVAPVADVSDLGENDISSLKIVVAGIQDGALEILTIGGVTFNPTVTSSAIVTIGGTDFQITYTAGAGGTGTFNISQVGGGAIPQADLDELVQSVSYENTSQDPTAGDRTLTFTAKDTGNITSSPAVATITVVPVNDSPVAVDDSGSVSEDGPATNGNVITGSGTDSDIEGDPLTVTLAEQGGNTITLGVPFTVAGGGVLTLNADGSYTFDPGTAYNGLDTSETATETISYTISDGNGGTATALLVVTITGANDTPVVIDPANPGTAENPIPAGDPLNIIPDVTTNDGTALAPINVGSFIVDPDGETLTFTLDPATTPAWVVIDPATGVLTGTPPADASQLTNTGNPGEYLITITATDPDGALVTTTVTLTIVNLPPVANDDTGTAPEDGPPASGNVLGNDADTAPDSDPLTVTLAEQGGNTITLGVPFTVAGGGVLTLNADGSYTFDPGTAYNGFDTSETATETISYTISDGNGGTATALLVVTITGANDTPVVIDPANPGTAENPIPAGDPLNIIPDVTTNDGTALAPINVGSFIVDPDGETLTFTLDPATTPAWVVIDPATGVLTGTPPADASQLTNTGNPGEYLITITATDPDGALVTTTVTLTIVNLPPVANDDTGTAPEDGPPASGNVLGNDADTAPDSDPLTVTLAEQGGNTITLGVPFTVAGGGVLTLNADGSYTFDPGTAYNGLDTSETATETISYTISDGNGGTATALLVVTITGANDTPVVIDPANPGTAENPIPAGDPLNIIPDVTTNDGTALAPINVGSFIVDPDGETLTFTLDPATTPAWVVIDPATGVLTGTPPADASQLTNTGNPGEYLITITATDPDGALVTTTVTLTIVNLPPVANDDTGTAPEDGPPASGNVLGNDADTAPDSDPLTVTLAEQGGNTITLGVPFTVAGGGVLTLNADGSYTFDPGTAYNGFDTSETATETISYTISDGNGGTATALLVVTITGANDTPVVIDPANPGTAENPIPAGDPLNIIPDVTTNDGTALAPINVGSFIVDPDGETLTFTLDPATTPAWVVIDPATGVLTGTPPADASQLTNTGNPGEYLITITATDPDGALVTTTVTLTIVNLPPVANDDTGTAPEDGPPASGNVLGNDADTAPDSDPLTVTLAEQGGNTITLGVPFTVAGGGVLTLNADGSYTFDPGTAYNGLDTSETATETISYTISDGNGGTATALLVVTITGANDTPVVIDPANPGTAENPIPAGDPLNIIPDVTTNDGTALAPINVGSFIVDPDGETLTFTLDPATTPAWVVIDPATGVLTGTPPADASQLTNTGNPGEYLITITATDPDGALVTTTVTLTIVNLPPVANDDTGTAPEDGPPASGNVLGNDADTAPDSDPLTVTLAEQGGNTITLGVPFTVAGGGVLTLNADGSYTFDPGTAYNGFDTSETATETISYTISDGNGGTATALLVVTITGANDTPVVIDPANPGTAENPIPAGDPLNIIPDVTTNDGTALAPINVGSFIVDPDGETLTFTLDPATTPAWVVIDPATGVLTGTPPADASQLTNTGNPGEYLITITATDPDGALVTTTVTLTIVNLPPVANDDTGTAPEDGPPASGNVLGNDADTAPDSDPLTVTLAEQGGNTITLGVPFTVAGGGVLTLNADGSYTFDPGTAYNGLDTSETATETISYTISDGNGGTATALLVVTITGANDTPVVIDPANPGTAENPIPAGDPLNIIPDVTTNDGTALAPINVGSFIVDPDGETLTFTLDPATTPAWVVIDPATGVLTGTPPADASQLTNTGNPGEYLITITATDPDGALVTTTVTLTIVNLPPVAVDDGEFDALPGITNTYSVLGNDADTAPDSDPVSVVLATAANGTVTINPDGTLSYKANPGFVGADVITYTISDGNGGTATAQVAINVLPEVHIDTDAGNSSPADIFHTAIAPFFIESRIAAPPIVVSSVNDIDNLNGIGQSSLFDGTIDIETYLFGQSNGHFSVWSTIAGRALGEPQGMIGFSLRDGIGAPLGALGGLEDAAQVTISSFIRGRILMLNLDTANLEDGLTVENWRVTGLDGTPRPDWLEQTSQGFVMGERPADLEKITLEVTVTLTDGREVTKSVEIELKTGEIKQLKPGKRTDAPLPFDRQFKSRAMLNDRDIGYLGKALKKAARG